MSPGGTPAAVEGQASALQEARAELGGSGGGPPEGVQTLIVARVR